ncbi:hypothetical protein QPK87_25305 [Kamptonema cortianum]|nr:hypothetical protein [Kamptonema cortianum]
MKIESLKKPAIVGVCIIGGLIVLNIGSVLLFAQPEPKRQPLPELVALPTPTEQIAATNSARDRAWGNVQQKSLSLIEIAAQIDDQLRIGRAQRWQQHAKAQCDLEKCPSPYTWLINAYRSKGADLQRLALLGRLQTDATTVKAYRELQADLLDIAKALSIESGRPVPFVPSAALTTSIDELKAASEGFESIRKFEANQSYEGGDTNETR